MFNVAASQINGHDLHRVWFGRDDFEYECRNCEDTQGDYAAFTYACPGHFVPKVNK